MMVSEGQLCHKLQMEALQWPRDLQKMKKKFA